MTIQRGPYDSRKRAASVDGKLFRHDGKVYRAVKLTATRSASFADQWFAEIEVREATEAEERAMKLAEIRKDLDRRISAWSDDPVSPTAAANRAEVARLKEEIATIEATV